MPDKVQQEFLDSDEDGYNHRQAPIKGSESNEVVKAVEDEAFQLGKSGKDLVIIEKYNNAPGVLIRE